MFGVSGFGVLNQKGLQLMLTVMREFWSSFVRKIDVWCSGFLLANVHGCIFGVSRIFVLCY